MIVNQVFCNKHNYSFFKDNGKGYNENSFGISKAMLRIPRKVTHSSFLPGAEIMRLLLRKVLAIRLVILRTTFFMFLFYTQKAHKNSISANLFLA